MNQRLRCLSPSLPEVMDVLWLVVMAAAPCSPRRQGHRASLVFALLSLGHGLRTFHKRQGLCRVGQVREEEPVGVPLSSLSLKIRF